MTVSSSLLSGLPLLAPPDPACWTNTTTGQSILVSSMSAVEWVNSEEKPHSQPLPRMGDLSLGAHVHVPRALSPVLGESSEAVLMHQFSFERQRSDM